MIIHIICAKTFQVAMHSATGAFGTLVQMGARGCKGMQESARECKGVQGCARGRMGVQQGATGCKGVQGGGRGCKGMKGVASQASSSQGRL